MKSYKRENWRNCSNCIHNKVCSRNRNEECYFHIYNANPERYGDYREIIQPVYEWLEKHYPNDAFLTIRKRYSELSLEHKTFLREGIL